MRGFVDLIFFVAVLTQTNASIWRMPVIPENNTDILPAWRDTDKFFKNTASSLIKVLMPTILESTSRLNLSSECMKQGMQLVSGLKSMKTWAFSMVDASAKIPEGFASATFTHLGVYEQCLDIMVPHPRNKDQIQFQGQYCLAEVRFPLPPKSKRYGWFSRLEELKNFTGSEFLTLMSTKAHMNYLIPLTMGLCIPSGCTREDLKQLLHDQAGKYHFLSDVTHCEIKKTEVHFTEGQIAAIVVCCILGSLVILGTLLEMRSNSEKDKYRSIGLRILLSFSVITNFQKLTSTKTSSDSFSCLHGIRFLTITWVVLAHTYFYPGCFLSRYRLLFRIYDFASETFTQMMTNGSECVDTFFFMGGMLLSYFSLKHVKVDKKRFDVKALILHRIWRIVPVYYFILLCGMLVPLMGSGPMFEDTMEDSIYPCFRYWWRNLLFINNFFNMSEMCMLHFWYVACDMQLFLVSVVVLLAFMRSEKVGLFMSALIILSSIIYSGVITYTKDLMPTLTVAYTDPEDRSMFFFYTYGNVLSRAGPYFIGILSGYLLIKHRDIKIPKIIQVVGWCLAIVACGTIIFITSAWFKVYTPSNVELAVYAAFYKVFFTVGIAWMTLCCVTGRGGFINTFLSWKLWVPLSKLAFLIYLIHPYVQNIFIANFTTVQEVTHLRFVVQFFGFLSISALLAFVASLLIESPFLALEKVFFRRGERKIENMNGESNKAFQNGDFAVKVHEESNGRRENGFHNETNGMAQNGFHKESNGKAQNGYHKESNGAVQNGYHTEPIKAKSNLSEDQSNVLESWMKLDKTLKGATQSMIKYVMPMLMESTSQVNLSQECMKESIQLIAGLRNLKKWAFSFVDSTAKGMDGVLSGTFSAFGVYDQCLETTVLHPKKKDEILFQGQYCMIDFRFPLPPKAKRYRLYDRLDDLQNFTGTEVMKFFTTKVHLMYYAPMKLGICIPSGCTEDDLKSMLNFVASDYKLDIEIPRCEIKQKETTVSGIQVFAVVAICVLTTFLLLGTWMELSCEPIHNPSKYLGNRILLSFSAIANFKRLISTKTADENLRCLRGILFFTITWVVYGHAYLFPGKFSTNYSTLFRMPDVASEPVAQMIVNGSEAVDTFLFVGGMLVCYYTVKRVKIEKKSFNIFSFIFYKLLRVAPVLYFILLISTLGPLMGSGPVFHETMRDSVYSCFQHWWQNALFINNFFHSKQMCLKHTWFVSCELQLYLISIFVILPLIWSKKIGIVLNVSIVMASVVYTGVATYLFDLSPTVTITHLNPDDERVFFLYSYANILSRAGPYFIGVFTGYLLITKPDIKISKKVQIMGWFLATFSSGMIIFATGIWYNLRPPSFVEVILYSSLYKVAFTGGVAWMTFCCATGYGGFVNKILSWKVWMPLSKLVLLVFLIEPLIQITFIANFRSIQEFTHFQFVIQYFGFLWVSILLSIVVNLLVESPFLRLEELFFRSEPKKEEANGHANVGFENNGSVDKVTSIEMTTLENGIENRIENTEFYRRNIQDY
ncbi:Nose resistant to fluoxetine protein 6 like protein [Argiope bruennichi]|uniref:Nose resistant to fluoxetine protein 6 like protein n=1 Tax=Argiope bruennichi TaxID=94029 RepID=A0A8T0EUT1_ARGBR|nr:Nose resistant to fluoxetine protein 6 like protein [Argiope bruennichi]KAF8782075.1 Nose resistant to fluoxetine protein 6 like protein [Argiope bruennichi]